MYSQMESKPGAECTLVDHGGRFSVESVNLRRLLPEFEIFAHQGIRCALKVRPLEADRPMVNGGKRRGVS